MAQYTQDDLIQDGDGLHAFGHPSECGEPVDGSCQITDTGITLNGIPVGSRSNGSLEFPTHSHDTTTDEDGNTICTNDSAHSITPTVDQTGITINGDNALLSGTIASTDPVSGGEITDI